MKRTYGLRPRTQLRRPSYDCDSEEKEPPTPVPKKEPRSKIRGTIVAKYRRLTANARERQRMKEINDAFTTLQGILPTLQSRQNSSSSGGSSRASMTKIRTLRHAASYIQALSDLLSGADPQGTPFHRDFQNYSGPFQDVPTNLECEQSRDSFCSVQQPLFKLSQNQKSPDLTQNHTIKSSYLSASTNSRNSEEETQLVVDQNLPWEDVQTTDEELFSLLEKEVMSMRNGHLQDDANNPSSLEEIGWSEEFVRMGCK